MSILDLVVQETFFVQASDHRRRMRRVIAAFAIAVYAFFTMIASPAETSLSCSIACDPMVQRGGLNLDIAFGWIRSRMVMTLIITGVGGLIHIYQTGTCTNMSPYSTGGVFGLP